MWLAKSQGAVWARRDWGVALSLSLPQSRLDSRDVGEAAAWACQKSMKKGQNLSTKPSEVLVKSTFPGDWAIGTPRISRSSNVLK